MTDDLREKLYKLVVRDTDKLILAIRKDPLSKDVDESEFIDLKDKLSEYGANAWWLLDDDKNGTDLSVHIIYTYYQMYHGLVQIPQTKLFSRYAKSVIGETRDRSLTGLLANGFLKVNGEYRTIVLNKARAFLKSMNYPYDSFRDIDNSMQKALENKLLTKYAKELKINRFNREKLG